MVKNKKNIIYIDADSKWFEKDLANGVIGSSKCVNLVAHINLQVHFFVPKSYITIFHIIIFSLLKSNKRTI